MRRFEYARAQTPQLDKDYGAGWQQMGASLWELVTVYVPQEGLDRRPVAIFKRQIIDP